MDQQPFLGVLRFPTCPLLNIGRGTSKPGFCDRGLGIPPVVRKRVSNMSKGIWVKSKNKVVDKSRKRLKILDRMVN